MLLTARLGGGPARRSDGIDNEETKNNSHNSTHQSGEGALGRPPIKHGARPLNAEERREHARDDDEYAKDAKGLGCA